MIVPDRDAVPGKPAEARKCSDRVEVIIENADLHCCNLLGFLDLRVDSRCPTATAQECQAPFVHCCCVTVGIPNCQTLGVARQAPILRKNQRGASRHRDDGCEVGYGSTHDRLPCRANEYRAMRFERPHKRFTAVTRSAERAVITVNVSAIFAFGRRWLTRPPERRSSEQTMDRWPG